MKTLEELKEMRKNWEIIGFYKDMLIYRKENILYFGNKHYTNAKPKSVMSAKNLITRYVNKLTKREKTSLKYLKYEI